MTTSTTYMTWHWNDKTAYVWLKDGKWLYEAVNEV